MTTVGKTPAIATPVMMTQKKETGSLRDAVKQHSCRMMENELTDIKVSKNKHKFNHSKFLNNKFNNYNNNNKYHINQQQFPPTTTSTTRTNKETNQFEREQRKLPSKLKQL